MTTITPFEARAPQIEAAAASFKIEIFATSFGLMEAKPVEIGKPSTTISGSASDCNVPLPRILKEISPSAVVVACTPATLPTRRSAIVTEGFSNAFSLMMSNAPVARSLEIV